MQQENPGMEERIEQAYLVDSFSAQDWAKAFIENAKQNPDMPFDEGAMIGWFANAIMTGYDNARAKYEMVNLNDYIMGSIVN